MYISNNIHVEQAGSVFPPQKKNRVKKMYIKKTCEEMTENKRLKKSDIIDFPSGHPHHSSLLLLLEVDTCENLTSVRTPEFDPDCRFRFLGPNPRSYV